MPNFPKKKKGPSHYSPAKERRLCTSRRKKREEKADAEERREGHKNIRKRGEKCYAAVFRSIGPMIMARKERTSFLARKKGEKII